MITTSVSLIFSCKGKDASNSPTKTLQSLIPTVKNGNFTSITNNFCKSDKATIDSLKPLIDAATKLVGKDFNEFIKEKMQTNGNVNFDKIEFKNEKINGDNATVDIVNNNNNNDVQTINLTKENGDWKICMGLADKLKSSFSNSTNPDAPKSIKDITEKMKSPEMQNNIKKAQEVISKMSPEEREKMMKMGQDAMKNMTPEQMEKLKKLGEQMQGH